MVPDLTLDKPHFDLFWHNCRLICPILPAQEPCRPLQLHRGIAAGRKHTTALLHMGVLRGLQLRPRRKRDSEKFSTRNDWLLLVIFCHCLGLYLCGQVFSERSDPDPESAYKNCFPRCCSSFWRLVCDHTCSCHLHRDFTQPRGTRHRCPLLRSNRLRIQSSNLG